MAFLDYLPLIGDVTSALIGADAQHDANRQNIRLSREQRAWEQQMADTAIQRRVADYKKAGLNPILAAGGPGATSPSVSAPTVEPTFRGDALKGSVGSAALVRAQLDNIAAQTALTRSQTKGQEIKNNVANAFAMAEHEINLTLKNMQADKGPAEWRLLDQQLKNAVQQEINLQLTAEMTAAQVKQFREMSGAVVQEAMQQARAGQIDLEALERIASIGGVDASKVEGVIRTVLDAIRVFTQKRGR